MVTIDRFQPLLVLACPVFALNYHSQGLRPIMFPTACWKRSSDQNITRVQLPASLNRRLLGFTRRSEVFLQYPQAPIHISMCLIQLSRCPQPHQPSLSITVKQTSKNQKRDVPVPSLPPTAAKHQASTHGSSPGSRFAFTCGSQTPALENVWGYTNKSG